VIEPVATTEGIVAIVPDYVAHGFISAMLELFGNDDVDRAYAKASYEAARKLTDGLQDALAGRLPTDTKRMGRKSPAATPTSNAERPRHLQKRDRRARRAETTPLRKHRSKSWGSGQHRTGTGKCDVSVVFGYR
jgi:hypothetical protein